MDQKSRRKTFEKSKLIDIKKKKGLKIIVDISRG